MAVLGGVTVENDGDPVSLGTRKQRALLAALALHVGEVVSSERIVSLIWGDRPPAGVQHTLHAYLSGLRRALEPTRATGQASAVLRTVGSGYQLDLPRNAVDAFRLVDAVTQAQALLGPGATDAIPHVAEQDATRARVLLEDGLSLWRGEPYLELGDAEAAVTERVRLRELALAARELLAVARLSLGDQQALAADLEADATAHPYRERLRVLQALALVRSGRQAEALEVLRAVRKLLADELGVDPGRDLAELESAILRQDPKLAAPMLGRSGKVLGPAPVLPGRLTPLVGRDTAVNDVAELLRAGATRMLTLLGPGGAGKTRLALAAAEAVGDAFQDGLWWVDLAAVTDPDLVLPVVARALGLREDGAQPLPRLLAEHLRRARVLLVLDNLEQVAACGPRVAQLLATCPDVTALVTSRVALRVQGEQRWPVPPLGLPDDDAVGIQLEAAPAAALLLQRARAVDPALRVDDDDAPAFVALCHRLGGSPLALELAAPWLALLRPQELLGQLMTSLDVLADGTADFPERQRTLRATLAWSVGLLDPADRDALAALGVLTGGGDLAAATAICGHPVLARVASLADHSLLRLERDGATSRIVLDEPVREYALEMLAAGDNETAVRGRHAEHFVAFMADAKDGLAGADQGHWLRRIDADAANVLASLAHMRRSGQVCRALRLTGEFALYWWRRGQLLTGRYTLQEALAHAETARSANDDPREWALAQANARYGTGLLSAMLGDHAAAHIDLDRAVQLLRSLGDDPQALPILARALLQLARTIRESEHDTEGAKALLAEAEQLCQAIDDPIAYVWVLRYQAHFVALPLGDLNEAERLHSLALALATKRGNTWAVAITLTDLAEVARDRGNLELAVRRNRDALRLFLSQDDRWYEAVCLHNLGHLAIHEGDPPRARNLFEESLAIHTRLGNRRGVAQCLAGLAAVAAAFGEISQGRALLDESDALLHELNTHLDRTDERDRNRTLQLLEDRETSEAEGRQSPRGV